jgi:DNA-binding transcriptional MerR regulator
MVAVDVERFRIGELARRVDATPRTVRYYEELGLLPERERADGAHRLYDELDVARLRDLMRIRDLLGLSLTQLREWISAEDARARLRERWHADPPLGDTARTQIARESLEHIDAQLRVVRDRRAALENLEDELTAKRRHVRTLLAELEEARR